MARSALNVQHNQQENRSLYFLLGLLSAARSVNEHFVQSAVAGPEPAADDSDTTGNDPDFLYFSLGMLALAHQLQAALNTERGQTVTEAVGGPQDHADTFRNVMY